MKPKKVLHDLIQLDLMGDICLAEMNGLMRLHSQEVARFATLVGTKLSLPSIYAEQFINDCKHYSMEPTLFFDLKANRLTTPGIFLFKICAKLHDIGTPFFRHSYHLERDLSRDEYEVQKLHANLARVLIKSWPLHEDFKFSNVGMINFVADMAAAHQERFDGTGYPDARSGTDIGLLGRMLSICDTVSAMLNPRPHKPSCTLADCLEQLERGAGTQFDPVLLSAIALILQLEPDSATRLNHDDKPCEKFSPEFLRLIQLINFDNIDLHRGDRKRLPELREVINLALAHERAVRHESVH